ncbi:DUF417 family protein [Kordiimonas lacus]|uniref:Uncharacterized membrane protein YkgB n=1 Tax=Kordiimonas lacus TaxID=637679 RepID=A0A1G6WWH2_9PROT|nr:DUF417 family protein [Kordiimonas lacus]SDD69547.1 Uncharacterized membrane protein YkgB [Kordiimonas lacus]
MTAIFDRLRPGAQFTDLFVTLSLAGVLIWFGLMNISGASAETVDRWLKGHMFLSGLQENKQWIMWALGGAQALSGLLIVLHSVPERVKRYAYGFVVLWSAASLSLLLTNPVWIGSLGGFPAIGSGQGLLKYITIGGLALWCLGHRHGKLVMLIGIIVVLGWIGGMKFTQIEADGIAPLLKTSPVFNWWLPVYLGTMQASYVIGAIELATVALLTGNWWNQRAYMLGLALAAGTFIVTLSFMVTFAPTWNGSLGGFPYLTSSGQFLLKDLLLLAGCCVLAAKGR